MWKNSRATTTVANATYAYPSPQHGLRRGDQHPQRQQRLPDSPEHHRLAGRARQTQTYTPQGGRLIGDTLYDSRGWTSKKNTNYWDSSTTPSAHPVDEAGANQVPRPGTANSYDGRPAGKSTTPETARPSRPPDDRVQRRRHHRHPARRRRRTPPGPTPSAAPVNRRVRLGADADHAVEHHTGIFYLTGGTTMATAYGYDGHGRQSTTTAKAEKWTSSYNLLGPGT